MNDAEPTTSLRIQRAERRVELLERMVEDRNREISITQEQATAVYSYLMDLNNVIPGAVISTSPDGTITRLNRGAHDLLEYGEFELSGEPLTKIWPQAAQQLQRFRNPKVSLFRGEAEWLSRSGKPVPVMMSAAARRSGEETLSLVFVGLDLSERRRLEIELRHAQKLESLGHLAAGVAHEINTPMQFIGDNVNFLDESLRELMPVLDRLGEMAVLARERGCEQVADELDAMCGAADLEFLRRRIPKAIDRAREGVSRVSRIVEAMKAFSHPQNEVAPVDINRQLNDTLTVARNEYKYVADVQCDLGDLPAVKANGSDLNQVFLNLLVNAAHAIEERVRGTDQRGTIRICTRHEDAGVHISISDDGSGIPEQVRHRIFDPFFTTKEVGRGTGQGLSISRTIIVDRHHGQLRFDTEIGKGTTFHVILPLEPPPATGGGA